MPVKNIIMMGRLLTTQRPGTPAQGIRINTVYRFPRREP
jgi:hypothetical protein